MNKKGVSLISLAITIVVLIILAAISFLASTDSINNANKVKFQNDLKAVVESLEMYNQKSNIYGIPAYNSNDLTWDGKSERAENTAKMEDQINEDTIKYIFSTSIPETLDGKITIEEGKVKVDKNYEYEYHWAVDLYSYMEY